MDLKKRGAGRNKKVLAEKGKNYLKNGKGNRSGEDLKKYEHTKKQCNEHQ